MGKRYKDLMSKITSFDNIYEAYLKTAKGNKYNIEHLDFKRNLGINLQTIQKELEDGTYVQGAYRQFRVFEPKERIINALPFKDRVVQHCINNIVEPLFERTFYSVSYACRLGKGTHKGVRDLQAQLRRFKGTRVYFLKMDFSKYFANINGKVLTKELQRKISDKGLLKLLSLFYSDKGIPIGNLLSQLFANIYGHIFDRFVKTQLRVKHYFRYMDDSIILAEDLESLKEIQSKLEIFIRLFMKLKFSKWSIQPIGRLINFLGYRIHSDYKLVRKDSVTRAKRKIKLYKRQDRSEDLRLFLASFRGHIQSADSFNLQNYLRKEYRLCSI